MFWFKLYLIETSSMEYKKSSNEYKNLKCKIEHVFASHFFFKAQGCLSFSYCVVLFTFIMTWWYFKRVNKEKRRTK